MPAGTAERVTLRTTDGLALEAELRTSDAPWAVAVLTHPHPQFGGSMRSIVTGALFAALPDPGVVALRFNFRGVGTSEGTHDDGRGERDDVVAALDAVHPIAEGLPLVVAGWSFGADVALAVADQRIDAWVAVAPPLRRDDVVAARDPRRKTLIVAEHDEFRPPASARDIVADWVNTRMEVVAGADHYFVGRTDRVVELCLAALRAAQA